MSPSPWAERMTFGKDVPCPRCHLTGQEKAPAMTKAESRDRARENQRRHAAKLDPLPKPPTMVTCRLCSGRGTIPSNIETLGDQGPGEGTLL